MQLNPAFAYQPNPIVPSPTPAPSPPPALPVPTPTDYGLLTGLIGKWSGRGFNTIWRPNHGGGGDHFLELNLTAEELEFEAIPGSIPNRGLLQGDLFMAGLRYLQQVTDANLSPQSLAGIHLEPGLWLTIPATTDPAVPASVARLASVPHGTSLLAQGVAAVSAGVPTIPAVNITPFTIGNPAALQTFPEQQNLDKSMPLTRTGQPGLNGITSAMLENPNGALNADPTTVNTVTLTVSSDATTPTLGGGTANTAFLQGGPDGPNAVAARVDATFWLQTRKGEAQPGLLQYSQTVLLNFNGLSWPHVSVATLSRAPDSPSA